jgi:hypothetical protein
MVKEQVVRKHIEPGMYRHFKGGLYEVLDTVIDSETLSTMVLYRPVGAPDLWVRPYDMFVSTVERDGWVGKRFEFLGKR